MHELGTQIDHYMKALHLKGMLPRYQELAGRATDEKLQYEEYLALLLEEEYKRRQEGSIKARIAKAHFPYIKTMEEFMPVFFRELQRDGQIDRATSVARGTVRERADWWMPVLFMRLKSGRIWYTPGFAGDEQGGLKKWPAVLRNIKRKRCTPILGPGLSEFLLGSRREMARRWAEKYHFPMSPYHREDLPQVAQ